MSRRLDCSVYTMRQASRRSWHNGQTRPVKVVFMFYRGTLQSDTLKLVTGKLQSSLAVEGELPEDGLAAYGDDGDDVMMALARRIVSGDEEDADTETMEEVFTAAPAAASRAAEFLVDDDCRPVEIGPEAVRADGNGHLVAIGNTVEFIPASGRHANGNGHNHDEADKPEKTLFSWADFVAEEPVKPKRRSRRPKPAVASLFESALTMEQEREAEPVGAGR